MFEAVLEARSRTLEALCSQQPGPAVLVPLCEAIELAIPGSRAGVTLLDRSTRIFEGAVFPSVSNDYCTALRGIAVDDRPGSCAHAVYDGKPVECADVASDERFSQGWKDLCLAHGLRALISLPAFHRGGFALGTLVVAYDPERPLTGEQRALCEAALHTVAEVLSYLRRQQRQELLMGELRHRVANVFATIGAMVYSTLRTHPDMEAFREAFDGRLKALARAHTLALDVRDPELRTLLSEMLAPYREEHEIELEGPDIVLAEDAAFALGLAVHELATNAVKYGSLSRPGGGVQIGWDFAGETRNRFVMTWAERGGPRVRKPERSGIGDRTIRGSLAAAIDAKVDISYRPSGLVCHIDAPRTSRLGSPVN